MALTDVSRPTAFPRALVWFFACVKAVVSLQVAFLVELSAAPIEWALVVWLIIVFFEVYNHVALFVI